MLLAKGCSEMDSNHLTSKMALDGLRSSTDALLGFKISAFHFHFNNPTLVLISRYLHIFFISGGLHQVVDRPISRYLSISFADFVDASTITGMHLHFPIPFKSLKNSTPVIPGK